MSNLEPDLQKLILIGSSTGGPGHIEKILKALPLTFSSKIIIAQHMDKKLLESFSTRLNSICTVEVRIASDSIMLEEMPSVLICSQTCTIERLGHRHKLTHIKPDHATYNPEIDTFFKSMVAYTDRFKILCILLTGIGSDGAIGMLELRKKGALTIAESEESAVVFGMPRSADEMGAASKVLPLDKIIEEILHFDTTAI